MSIDFKDYISEEFKRSHDGKFRLYHDWLYDKVFASKDVPKDLIPIIKRVLFRASYSTLWVGELVKIEYQRECVARAKAPSGELKGKVISKLSEKDRSLLPALYRLLKEESEFVSKAAYHKIEQIKFYTDNK